MVLTNFELWAADGSTASSLPLDFESNARTRHQMNPFDPRVLPQLNANFNHLSSNGYYGFSYINAAHIGDNNNNNISNNDNNNNAHNFMGNDVNGMNNTVTTPQQTNASSVNLGSTACAAGNAASVARCKKRYFVINDDTAAVDTVTNNYEVSAKRCRFDDDFSAQYCNDFFQLPSTQIATQSCLMDIEEAPQQQQQQHMLQQQVDDEALLKIDNNIEKYEQNTNRQLENVQTLSAQTHHQQQHNQHSQQQQLMQTQQQPEQQQQHLYHLQQYYQDVYTSFKRHVNNKHTCDTLTFNNTGQTRQIGTIENLFKTLNSKPKNNPKSNENKICKIKCNKVAKDFKVDDGTLFEQLHGGCLHHHHVPLSSGSYKSKANTYLKDENHIEEF